VSEKFEIGIQIHLPTFRHLTLRDLIEGDIPLGFGASKGYGSCIAKITGVRVPTSSPGAISPCLRLLEDFGIAAIDFAGLLKGDWRELPEGQWVMEVLRDTVERYDREITSYRRKDRHHGKVP